MEMFLPLMIGATIVIGTKRMLIDMEKLKKAIIDNDITVLQATPVTWTMLVSKEWKNETKIKMIPGFPGTILSFVSTYRTGTSRRNQRRQVNPTQPPASR